MLKVFYLGLAKFNEVEVLSNSRPLTIKKVLKQHLIYYYYIILLYKNSSFMNDLELFQMSFINQNPTGL